MNEWAGSHRIKLMSDIVKKAHENNLKVFVYTVNSENGMKDMIDYKVDGIFTDFPELMKEILK